MGNEAQKLKQEQLQLIDDLINEDKLHWTDTPVIVDKMKMSGRLTSTGYMPLLKLINSEIPAGTSQTSDKAYHAVIRPRGSNGAQISLSLNDEKVTLEFNPSKWETPQEKGVLWWIISYIEQYIDGRAMWHISRVDVAFNIFDDLSEVYVTTKKNRQRTTFGVVALDDDCQGVTVANSFNQSGKFLRETVYLGQRHGDTKDVLRVYDKRRELLSGKYSPKQKQIARDHKDYYRIEFELHRAVSLNRLLTNQSQLFDDVTIGETLTFEQVKKGCIDSRWYDEKVKDGMVANYVILIEAYRSGNPMYFRLDSNKRNKVTKIFNLAKKYDKDYTNQFALIWDKHRDQITGQINSYAGKMTRAVELIDTLLSSDNEAGKKVAMATAQSWDTLTTKLETVKNTYPPLGKYSNK